MSYLLVLDYTEFLLIVVIGFLVTSTSLLVLIRITRLVGEVMVVEEVVNVGGTKIYVVDAYMKRSFNGY